MTASRFHLVGHRRARRLVERATRRGEELLLFAFDVRTVKFREATREDREALFVGALGADVRGECADERCDLLVHGVVLGVLSFERRDDRRELGHPCEARKQRFFLVFVMSRGRAREEADHVVDVVERTHSLDSAELFRSAFEGREALLHPAVGVLETGKRIAVGLHPAIVRGSKPA